MQRRCFKNGMSNILTILSFTGVVSILCSCDDDKDSGPTAEETVGMECSDDGDCNALPGAYCPSAGTCTAGCSMHEQCGCSDDTTNTDIADGKCDAACIALDEDETVVVCLRVCRNASDCEVGSDCYDLGDFSVCY